MAVATLVLCCLFVGTEYYGKVITAQVMWTFSPKINLQINCLDVFLSVATGNIGIIS
jgi:hypothetical protein